MLLINAAAAPPFPALEVSMPKPIPVIPGVRLLSKYLLNAVLRSNSEGDYRLIRFGFVQANEAAACMEVATLIWKIDLLVLTEKETDEVRTIGN